MVQPKYNPEEALERVKLMMNYDLSKTLNENKRNIKVLNEDSIDTDVEKSVQRILNACTNRPDSEGTLNAADIASKFNRAFKYQLGGFMGGTDDSLWREQAEIMKKGNFDDLCNIKNEFESLGYGNFAEQLVEELDDEELAELMETFSAMKYKTDKAAKLAVASTEQKNINWFKKSFPCIFDSDSNIDQQVRMNQNNYVYIIIKGSSGKQYQLFADGRVKDMGGKSLNKRVACQGSRVSLVNESEEKKKIVEQFDDSSLNGGDSGQRRPNPRPNPRPRPKSVSKYKPCTGQYHENCKSNVIKKVQACLGMELKYQTGNFGPITKRALQSKGFTTFTDADVDKICGVQKPVEPEVGTEILSINPNDL